MGLATAAGCAKDEDDLGCRRRQSGRRSRLRETAAADPHGGSAESGRGWGGSTSARHEPHSRLHLHQRSRSRSRVFVEAMKARMPCVPCCVLQEGVAEAGLIEDARKITETCDTLYGCKKTEA